MTRIIIIVCYNLVYITKFKESLYKSIKFEFDLGVKREEQYKDYMLLVRFTPVLIIRVM